MWLRCVRACRDRYIAWRYGAIDLTATLGKRGEQAAARYLRRRGLVIVAEGESDAGGEIDLVAVHRKRRTLIFVEVKTLATSKPGHPADRVDHAKQRQITRAALRFLKRKKLLGVETRFDVVAVWWPNDLKQPERIEHYVSAFDAVGDFQLY